MNKRKNGIIYSLLFLLVLTLSVSSVRGMNIGNCTDLQNMKNDVSANYVLTNNIDCSDTINWNGGVGFLPVGDGGDEGDFTGTFDGQGYNITDLYINKSTGQCGLFQVLSGGIIRNVGLINVTIICYGGYAGGLLAYNYEVQGGIVENSFVIDSNIGAYPDSSVGDVGGLVGYNSIDGIIRNSYSSGNVIGGYAVGGLVGTNRGYILNSSSSAHITTNDRENSGGQGGLVGQADFGGEIDNCFSSGNIEGGDGSGGFIGSLGWVGGGIINNSYSTGNVSGRHQSGGFIGYVYSGTIMNSYSVGRVENYTDAIQVGGFAGALDSGSCIDSFWDTETSGQLTSACGLGNTTTEMKTQSTFTNWDFVNTWDITPTYYPCLQFNCVLFPTSSLPIIIPVLSDNAIYNMFNSAGAGLGLFLKYVGYGLMILIPALIVVGIVLVMLKPIKKIFGTA